MRMTSVDQSSGSKVLFDWLSEQLSLLLRSSILPPSGIFDGDEACYRRNHGCRAR